MENEIMIRSLSFLTILMVMAGWEWIAPKRVWTTSKPRRWFINLGIAFLDTFLVRVIFASAPVGMAWIAEEKGWGFFNVTGFSEVFAFIAAIITLDFIIYLQHVMFHAIPMLWRLHMVHHSDLDFDASTGVRFHPIEIIISTIIKISAVAFLGTPPMAVLTFEILLNGTSLFNHSNVRIPEFVDRLLRLAVVTPDMHRVHHSVHVEETNTNFGFNLPWWDRFMGTYRPYPRDGHIGMTIGLSQFRNPERLSLPLILALPFYGETGNYPMNSGKRK